MWMYYVAVLLGCLIYLLLQLNGVFVLPEFKWSIFLKTNIVPTAINLVVGCALIIIKNEIVAFFPITLFSALLLGVSGQAIFKKLTNMFDSKVDTKFGMNG
jgi:hypothetical protein